MLSLLRDAPAFPFFFGFPLVAKTQVLCSGLRRDAPVCVGLLAAQVSRGFRLTVNERTDGSGACSLIIRKSLRL